MATFVDTQMPALWDLSAQWGTGTPKVATNATAGDTTLQLKGLGSGVFPAPSNISGWPQSYAWFRLAGVVYQITQAAQISNGTATVTIQPPLAADAAINALITDYNTLCTDDDMAQQESRMPALGQKVQGGGGRTAYTGKRALAKKDITNWLFRRGYQPVGVANPEMFNRAAVFLELSYIYRDMANRNDQISSDKADHYRAEYESEIENLQFAYVQPLNVEENKIRPVATWWRS